MTNQMPNKGKSSPSIALTLVPPQMNTYSHTCDVLIQAGEFPYTFRGEYVRQTDGPGIRIEHMIKYGNAKLRQY